MKRFVTIERFRFDSNRCVQLALKADILTVQTIRLGLNGTNRLEANRSVVTRPIKPKAYGLFTDSCLPLI
jgi:hypothetical protein